MIFFLETLGCLEDLQLEVGPTKRETSDRGSLWSEVAGNEITQWRSLN